MADPVKLKHWTAIGGSGLNRTEDPFGSILALLGEIPTFLLLEAYGGRELYVPTAVAQDNPFLPVVGAELAQVLAHNLGGSHLQIPLARPWRVSMWWRAGKTRTEISEHLKITHSSVCRALVKFGFKKDQWPKGVEKIFIEDLSGSVPFRRSVAHSLQLAHQAMQSAVLTQLALSEARIAKAVADHLLLSGHAVRGSGAAEDLPDETKDLP